eukprot:6071774-Prymnesium_polylepis.1
MRSAARPPAHVQLVRRRVQCARRQQEPHRAALRRAQGGATGGAAEEAAASCGPEREPPPTRTHAPRAIAADCCSPLPLGVHALSLRTLCRTLRTLAREPLLSRARSPCSRLGSLY